MSNVDAPELKAGTPLDGDERWSFVTNGTTDRLTDFINKGNPIPAHSLPLHIDCVEIDEVYPTEKRRPIPKEVPPDYEEKTYLKGIHLGATAVNGERVPFSIFIPDGIKDGHPFEPFSSRQVAHIREKAARREVEVVYQSLY